MVVVQLGQVVEGSCCVRAIRWLVPGRDLLEGRKGGESACLRQLHGGVIKLYCLQGRGLEPVSSWCSGPCFGSHGCSCGGCQAWKLLSCLVMVVRFSYSSKIVDHNSLRAGWGECLQGRVSGRFGCCRQQTMLLLFMVCWQLHCKMCTVCSSLIAGHWRLPPGHVLLARDGWLVWFVFLLLKWAEEELGAWDMGSVRNNVYGLAHGCLIGTFSWRSRIWSS